MRRLLVPVTLFMALAFAAEAHAQSKPKERTTMDPLLRGTWLLRGSSRDRGKTITEHDGDEFCRVT